ncbi:hypothetical protein [Allosphingosinicella flava]|uniref:hypothetical protein n=1 Tax=Allosphingosinicella flava TaxID=2771430 RepID=UPI001A9CA8D3|nr:hypothetical protein [Sphingosinicella flava]
MGDIESADEVSSEVKASVPRQGQTAESLSGPIGKRKGRDQAYAMDPMGRVNNRIANRVETRLRNRIDRNYSPAMTFTGSLEAASEARLTRVRTSGDD